MTLYTSDPIFIQKGDDDVIDQKSKNTVTSEILISGPWYLHENCLDFSALSNSILCFGIWGDQILWI